MTAVQVIAVVLVLAYGFWRWNTRKRVIGIGASLPADFPTNSFDHSTFEELLRSFVIDGNVDYNAWHRSPGAAAQLDRYLAAVGAYSPESHPERFAADNDALAYWIYAYNAFVIKAVLLHWPLGSVTDLKAPVELIRGLGFFYKLRFVAGGKQYSLYEIERDKVVRLSRDPRVHFLLNCASESCPAIRPELPRGDELTELLERATHQFVADPRNVRIDHAAREIRLSPIFKWYEKDFVRYLRTHALPSAHGAVDYVVSVAPAELRTDIENARGYDTVFSEYDWRINNT